MVDAACRGHCWHYAQFQHLMTNHRDEICCHCGEKVCRMLWPTENYAHGPYADGYGSGEEKGNVQKGLS